jgi:dTDP-4-dehydrorhamnose 3,5-epimerase
MDFTPLTIEGAWVANSPVWIDNRGSFREWFKREEVLSQTGIDFSVQQANISVSNKGVVRGIHYSLAPDGQAKWVTCTNGSIIDVIVDIRPNSSTYKKIEYINLSAEEGKAVLIGKGLGHGFIALEDKSIVSYVLSSPYESKLEYEINPMDPDLRINWKSELVGEAELIMSEKDEKGPTLGEQKLRNLLPEC